MAVARPELPSFASFSKASESKSNNVPHFICTTCGTQYGETDAHPENCPICLNERQYVGLRGQSWTTLVTGRIKTSHSRAKLGQPGLVRVHNRCRFYDSQVGSALGVVPGRRFDAVGGRSD